MKLLRIAIFSLIGACMLTNKSSAFINPEEFKRDLKYIGVAIFVTGIAVGVGASKIVGILKSNYRIKIEKK